MTKEEQIALDEWRNVVASRSAKRPNDTHANFRVRQYKAYLRLVRDDVRPPVVVDPLVLAGLSRSRGVEMTEDQIKHMASRFLGWKLPDNFNPDGGIIFDKVANLGTEHQYYREPSGTNLFNYTQALAMVRHMIGEPQ